MSEPIKPALTPEEWARAGEPGVDGIVYAGQLEWRGDVPLHALGALCLRGQTFGFSRDDVEDELAAARTFERLLDAGVASGILGDEVFERAKRHRARAARIAALLPPDGDTSHREEA